MAKKNNIAERRRRKKKKNIKSKSFHLKRSSRLATIRRKKSICSLDAIMLTISEPAMLRFHSQTNLLPKSRLTDERTATTMTTLPSELRRPHAPSLVSMSTESPRQPNRPGDNFYSFTLSTLKNKSFLVPTRLALKRQRASLKDPVRAFVPLQSESLQLELGNPDDFLIRWSPPSQTEEDEMRLEFSPEQQRLQHSSQCPGPLRMNTPFNAPADISLLYK